VDWQVTPAREDARPTCVRSKFHLQFRDTTVPIFSYVPACPPFGGASVPASRPSRAEKDF
jgi:hypothetical protein